LQIGKIDTDEIDNPQGSNAACCQVKRTRGAQTAGADAQNPRRFKSLLSLNGYFGHDEMPGVALQFCSTQLLPAGALRIDDAFPHVATYFSTKYWNYSLDPRSRQLWGAVFI